jgi:hypothetical protein
MMCEEWIQHIGDWTTDIYLMFCLQSYEHYPLTLKKNKVKVHSGLI